MFWMYGVRHHPTRGRRDLRHSIHATDSPRSSPFSFVNIVAQFGLKHQLTGVALTSARLHSVTRKS